MIYICIIIYPYALCFYSIQTFSCALMISCQEIWTCTCSPVFALQTTSMLRRFGLWPYTLNVLESLVAKSFKVSPVLCNTAISACETGGAWCHPKTPVARFNVGFLTLCPCV